MTVKTCTASSFLSASISMLDAQLQQLWIQFFATRPKSILDVGCGTGAMLNCSCERIEAIGIEHARSHKICRSRVWRSTM
jgi:ubiquinone/menaquinone biosynthesis C-methylase UbiE